MADNHDPTAAWVSRQMQRMQNISTRLQVDPQRAKQQQQVCQWQAERLQQNHHDFLHHPRYRPAMQFFLQELYGPLDFSARDRDIERALPTLVRTLPGNLRQVLGQALELNALSQELDDALAQALFQEAGEESITPANYAAAYRRTSDQATRMHQVRLIRELGEQLDRAVKLPLVGSALRMARRPAQLAGFGVLQSFLERGFHAFRHCQNGRTLTATVADRERCIAERLYEGDPEPFRPR